MTKFSQLHQAAGLGEREGAWAEAPAFNFVPADPSPWETYYGPVASATKPDGTPSYAPDLAAVDDEIIAHWEERSVDASDTPCICGISPPARSYFPHWHGYKGGDDFVDFLLRETQQQFGVLSGLGRRK